MEYRAFGTECLAQVRALYEDSGWRAYLNDDAALARAIERSLFVLGAFDEDRLVGLVRCVGDGEHIVYVQDLIVHSACRRRGVGGALLRAAMARFERVRMFTLITDAGDECANAFYGKMGLNAYAGNGIAGYFR